MTIIFWKPSLQLVRIWRLILFMAYSISLLPSSFQQHPSGGLWTWLKILMFPLFPARPESSGQWGWYGLNSWAWLQLLLAVSLILQLFCGHWCCTGIDYVVTTYLVTQLLFPDLELLRHCNMGEPTPNWGCWHSCSRHWWIADGHQRKEAFSFVCQGCHFERHLEASQKFFCKSPMVTTKWIMYLSPFPPFPFIHLNLYTYSLGSHSQTNYLLICLSFKFCFQGKYRNILL